MNEGGLLRWLALAAVVAGSVCVAFVLASSWDDHSAPSVRKRTASRSWKPETWAPVSDADRVVDRFLTLRKAGEKSALDLLGPAPAFDDEPVDRKTAEARWTDFFLRSDLHFRDIWRGEPDGQGGQRPTPQRYTIVTKGNASTPKLAIQTNRGVEVPSQLMMTDPDLVVDVRDGKIQGLRAELHLGP
jgi:hypothetical protein